MIYASTIYPILPSYGLHRDTAGLYGVPGVVPGLLLPDVRAVHVHAQAGMREVWLEEWVHSGKVRGRGTLWTSDGRRRQARRCMCRWFARRHEAHNGAVGREEGLPEMRLEEDEPWAILCAFLHAGLPPFVPFPHLTKRR